jgi:hypothetical protein
MKVKKILTLTFSFVVLMAAASVAGDMPTEPRGGQPSKGAKPFVLNDVELVK